MMASTSRARGATPLTSKTVLLLRVVATVSLLATSIGVQGCVGTIASSAIGATGKVAGSAVGATGHVAGSAIRGGRGQH